MTPEGYRLMLRVEWRLAIEYGRCCGSGDLVWLRAIEDAWGITRGLMERGPQRKRTTQPAEAL